MALSSLRLATEGLKQTMADSSSSPPRALELARQPLTHLRGQYRAELARIAALRDAAVSERDAALARTAGSRCSWRSSSTSSTRR
jgi:hypothetical protein